VLTHALPNYRIHSFEFLAGGATNFNLLVRFEARDELFVLRQYLRGGGSLSEGSFPFTIPPRVDSGPDHRNVLVSYEGDRWELAGIVDWELAGIGTSFWDVARFMCYAKPDAIHGESRFMDGFRSEYGGTFPDNWASLSCVVNTLGAAASLASGWLQERFIPELKRVVHAGLRGERVS